MSRGLLRVGRDDDTLLVSSIRRLQVQLALSQQTQLHHHHDVDGWYCRTKSSRPKLATTDDPKPKATLGYRSLTAGECAMADLVNKVVSRPARGFRTRKALPSCVLNSASSLTYHLRLLRRLLLARFELLCSSEEAFGDPEFSRDELRRLCEATELYHSRLRRVAHLSSLLITLADFTEVAVSSLSRRVAADLLVALQRDHVHDSGESTRDQSADLVPAILRIISERVSEFLRTFIELFRERLPLAWPNIRVEEMGRDLDRRGREFSERDEGGLDTSLAQRTYEAVVTLVWQRVSQFVLSEMLSSCAGSKRRERVMDGLASCLRETSDELVLRHTATWKCVWYVLLMLEQHLAMAAWSKAMANLLSSSRATTSAVYKAKELHSTTETSDIFLSQVLPPLLQYLTRTLKPCRQPGRITAADRILADTATHIDTLKLALPLCCATLASLRQIHSFLWHGLQRQGPLHAHVHLAAQLLFVDCPAVLSEVSPVVLRGIAATCAPQVSVPHHCSLSLLLATCRDTYGCLHQLRCGLQETLEAKCLALHDALKTQCHDVLVASFPSRKQWKALSKRRRRRRRKRREKRRSRDLEEEREESTPLEYAAALIQRLLLPLLSAAVPLPAVAQGDLLRVGMAVVVSQLNKAIASNRAAYSSETAQQLLQDLRSIVAWTSSPNRGLHPGTALLLTSLPFVSEMEAGLKASVSTSLSATQATDTRETDLHEVQEGVATNGSLPLPHPFPPSSSSSRQLSRERTGSGVEGGWVDKCFPVFAELAWQSLALGQQQSLHRKK